MGSKLDVDAMRGDGDNVLGGDRLDGRTGGGGGGGCRRLKSFDELDSRRCLPEFS